MATETFTSKKDGHEFLLEAARALIALPELGSGNLLPSHERIRLINELETQCYARAEERISPKILPEVIKAIVQATVHTNITLTPYAGLFLAHQTDPETLKQCLSELRVTDNWEVVPPCHLCETQESARKRVTTELFLMFKTMSNASDEDAQSCAEHAATRILWEGTVPLDTWIEIRTYNNPEPYAPCPKLLESMLTVHPN